MEREKEDYLSCRWQGGVWREFQGICKEKQTNKPEKPYKAPGTNSSSAKSEKKINIQKSVAQW
jgi:hypothetical protein